MQSNWVPAKACARAKGLEAFKWKGRECSLPQTLNPQLQDAFRDRQGQFWLEDCETRNRRNHSPSTVTDTSTLLIRRVNCVMQLCFFSYSTSKDLSAIAHLWHTSLFICEFLLHWTATLFSQYSLGGAPHIAQGKEVHQRGFISCTMKLYPTLS